RSLVASHTAADQLIAAYTEQVLQSRMSFAPRLSTWLGCSLVEENPRHAPWAPALVECSNCARVGGSWALFAIEQGQYRWDKFDTQLAWCRKRRLRPMAGPVLSWGWRPSRSRSHPATARPAVTCATCSTSLACSTSTRS